ncbi:MAG: UDP-N-acetylmuramoyl-L-alanyl-D-glutamate--2,6-diaminopimelate ligase [Coriobacteriia bacterium]|nr:UDP-N-acetylmuramoyl-L-alanyl-D-glutamate--2,6-diaminopimelate ligase [Coriobacteriia bacterium]MBN2841128.1 UDP-N-acetylmuramoyl-L-alanyl-D-glutamate--2,6-diaminopimelate ligase [Coriobacteriia bacterium]
MNADAQLAQGVSGIAYRSDLTRPGDVFFCIPGFRRDGHDFASDAVGHGATAIVCERPVDVPVPQVIVPSARRALAVAAARFYGEPSRRLAIAGITGTNGKTTTTYLLDSILRRAGRTTGLIGTVETRIGDVRQPSARTTPESADLQALLAEMIAQGVDAASMEVSSHAIDLHRVDTVSFAVAAFTNLTQDHLDYHHTLAEYWSVKKRLFTDLDVRERVIDVDDGYGADLAASLGGVWTVGRTPAASVRAVGERPGADSTAFTLVTPGGSAELVLPLAGAYNVSNALVAAGCGLALGIGLDEVACGLEHAPQVPGRLERIDEGQPFTVLVDYAHTPDSLAKAIAAVRAVTPGRVITVFGCGGDRDPEKRPLMGEAAGAASDVVVVTSDNPRSEDPVGIILAIEDGLRSTSAEHTAEVDRRSAIARALEMAEPGDAVLIAGKGHEDYQIFSDRTIHFDDREVAREELRALC